MLVDRILQDVVVSGHIGGNQDVRTAARCHTHGAGGVEAVEIVAHGGCYTCAALFPFNAPFLVAGTP